MKDRQGIYYYPSPQNRRVRVYVRKNEGEVEFRLFNADEPALWDEHGWVPHSAILQASRMYQGKNFNPGEIYDLEVAEALLEEESLK